MDAPDKHTLCSPCTGDRDCLLKDIAVCGNENRADAGATGCHGRLLIGRFRRQSAKLPGITADGHSSMVVETTETIKESKQREKQYPLKTSFLYPMNEAGSSEGPQQLWWGL